MKYYEGIKSIIYVAGVLGSCLSLMVILNLIKHACLFNICLDGLTNGCMTGWMEKAQCIHKQFM